MTYEGVMYKEQDGKFFFAYEGVRGCIYPFTPFGLKKALRYISESDPWELWHDRYIIEKDFSIEVLN